MKIMIMMNFNFDVTAVIGATIDKIFPKKIGKPGSKWIYQMS